MVCLVVIRIRIEEEQKTQLPKEKIQKEKQRSTKHTHKTNYVLDSSYRMTNF
jgi:hypothetical protein